MMRARKELGEAVRGYRSESHHFISSPAGTEGGEQAIQEPAHRNISRNVSISEKGGVSLYWLGRFSVRLREEERPKLLAVRVRELSGTPV
jgi:hypothetical protein